MHSTFHMGTDHNITDRRLFEIRSRIESLLRYYEAQSEDTRSFTALLQSRLQELSLQAH